MLTSVQLEVNVPWSGTVLSGGVTQSPSLPLDKPAESVVSIALLIGRPAPLFPDLLAHCNAPPAHPFRPQTLSARRSSTK